MGDSCGSGCGDKNKKPATGTQAKPMGSCSTQPNKPATAPKN